MKNTFKKSITILLTAAVVCSFAIGLTACQDPNAGKFALSYARGAYTATGDMPETKYYAEGETVTLAPSDTFALTGYTLSGWSDDDGNAYDCGATFTMPAHDVKLMGTWVEGDPNAAVVTASSVGFDGGYFVVTGAVKNADALYVYLTNTNVSASADNYVQAEITGNTFTARLELDKLIGFNQSNIPFNLRYKVDSLSATAEGVAQGSLDISQTYTHNEYAFRLAVNSGSGCVAVYYSPAPNTTVSVSATAVAFDDEYFTVTGTVQNASALYVYLINTNVSASADNYVQAEITGNAFTARLELDKLIACDVGSNIPFNLRYRAEGSAVNRNIEQGEMDISQTHTYGGKIFRMGINGGCVAVYYTAAPVEPEPNEPDYTVSVSSMLFTNGKFVISGDCGADVNKLIFHLHNTNSPVLNFTRQATIENGGFIAEFTLSEIKTENGGEPPKSYINVRYELNDDGYKSFNLLPTTNGAYFVGQEYRYGDRTWTLKADANRTYLNWSEVSDKYRITETKLEIVGGTPTLKITGTTTDEIPAAQLRLLLDKTMGTKQQKYIENAEIEAGKFSFTVDLSDLLASANSTAANAQQAYFIRLYNGETKIADINSRWASDLLWERGRIETDDAAYFLMKNTEWDNTSWNTLGICKFDK